MKVLRCQRESAFWNWVASRLPSSLVGIDVSCGYGSRHLIYLKGHKPSRLAMHFEATGDPAAEVEAGHEIVIYHPQYFSDFEDLARRYEAEHAGREVTLRLWEN